MAMCKCCCSSRVHYAENTHPLPAPYVPYALVFDVSNDPKENPEKWIQSEGRGYRVINFYRNTTPKRYTTKQNAARRSVVPVLRLTESRSGVHCVWLCWAGESPGSGRPRSDGPLVVEAAGRTRIRDVRVSLNVSFPQANHRPSFQTRCVFPGSTRVGLGYMSE